MLLRLSHTLMVIGGLAALAGCSGSSDSDDQAPQPALSGTVTIESRTRVDSDTANDASLGVASSNNTPATAQALPETGIVAGYLSASAGSYPADPEFAFNVDRNDVYRINLFPGDRVVLQVFPSAAGSVPDVAMSIAEPGGADVCGDNCDGFPPFTHIMDLPGQDPVTHLIDVEAVDGGPFRYVLTVSSARSLRSTSVSFEQPAMVANEAIILTSDGPDAGALPAAADIQAMSPALSAAGLRDLGRGFWQVSRPAAGAFRGLSSGASDDDRVATSNWIRELRQTPGVRLAEPNYRYEAKVVNPEDDPLYSLQWHYPLISLPVAWQAAPQGGAGIGVAVMDTGLFSATPATYGNWHPDLDANVVPFSGETLDFVSGSLDVDAEDDGDRDSNPADPGNGPAATVSSSFHGTHVAGIVAGSDNTQGIVGVAPFATLYPVRVLGRNGEGNTADLIAALNWATNNPDVDVINLSLGGVADSEALQTAIDQAYASGKLLVAAAGNENSDAQTYPAAYERVVGVGAVDGGRQRASYSNVGVSVDLVAPGGDASRDANFDGEADYVVSTWGDDAGNVFAPRYAGLQGTSMAAPHVAGVYALMKGAAQASGGDVSPGDFFALMLAGDITDDLGSSVEFGAGLINALAAVDAVLAGSIPTVAAASPATMQFSDSTAVQTLSLSVYPEDDAITLDSVGALPDWVSLQPPLQAGSTLPTEVDVVVNTAQLSLDATYTAEIELAYTAGAEARVLTIPIGVQRADQNDQRDAGRQFVQLIDPFAAPGEQLIQQLAVDASSGVYRFEFFDVAPGEYLLVSGSDLDNDGNICQNGEACAEYGGTGLAQFLTVTEEPLTGVTMVTGYRRPTVSALDLPRYGFEGYPLQAPPSNDVEPDRNYAPGQ